MTLPYIAVTGATGFIGGHTARTLAAVGLPQRLIVRDPARAPKLPLADVAVAAFGDRSGVEHALEGIDTEEHLRASGMAWTFLRDNFYLDFMPMMVGDDGVIRGPAGNGRAALVSRRDVAAAAGAILQDPAAHAGRTYELTGPEALTMAEIAAILSAGLQRSISFHNETVEEAYDSRKAWDAPQWQYDAWVSTYTSIESGAMAKLSTSVEELTGRKPQSLAESLAEQAV